jgi:cytochrome c2
VWDAGTLERYISDPESVVVGTSMSAPPLRDDQERTDVVAYLALSGPYNP